MSLQLAAAFYVYINHALKKKRKSSGGGKGNCTQAGKCAVVQVG
jgi:hypothetical protein